MLSLFWLFGVFIVTQAQNGYYDCDFTPAADIEPLTCCKISKPFDKKNFPECFPDPAIYVTLPTVTTIATTTNKIVEVDEDDFRPYNGDGRNNNGFRGNNRAQYFGSRGKSGGNRGSKNRGNDNGYRGDNNGYQGDNNGFRGDNDGFRGDNNGFRGDNNGFRGDNNGFGSANTEFRGNNNGLRGNDNGFRGDNNEFRGNNNGFRGGNAGQNGFRGYGNGFSGNSRGNNDNGGQNWGNSEGEDGQQSHEGKDKHHGHWYGHKHHWGGWHGHHHGWHDHSHRHRRQAIIQIPTKQNTPNCAIECIFNQTNVLSNDVFDRTIALEVYADYYPEIDIDLLTRTVDRCAKQLKNYQRERLRRNRNQSNRGKNAHKACYNGAGLFASCFNREIYRNCPINLDKDDDDCISLRSYIDNCAPVRRFRDIGFDFYLDVDADGNIVPQVN